MSAVQASGNTTQGFLNTRSTSVARCDEDDDDVGASGIFTASAITMNAKAAAATSTQYACCHVMTSRSTRAAGNANTNDALNPSATFDMAEALRAGPAIRLAAI